MAGLAVDPAVAALADLADRTFTAHIFTDRTTAVGAGADITAVVAVSADLLE